MGDSIRELKAILDAKGGPLPNLSTEDLQALVSYISTMVSNRDTTLPEDDGANRTDGYSVCSTHAGTTPPSSPLSVGDLDDWQSTGTNLNACSCNAETQAPAWCSSRTTCACDGRTATCACNGRTTCCRSRTRIFGTGDLYGTDTLCSSRTTCVCDSRTTCACNARCSCNTVDVFS